MGPPAPLSARVIASGSNFSETGVLGAALGRVRSGVGAAEVPKGGGRDGRGLVCADMMIAGTVVGYRYGSKKRRN